MFAVDVLLMNQQGFKVIQRDYEENKDKKDAKFKKAQVLLNYEIPLSELEELKERIKRLENLYYKTYFTGAEFIYKNVTRIVNDNELMVAIKI